MLGSTALVERALAGVLMVLCCLRLEAAPALGDKDRPAPAKVAPSVWQRTGDKQAARFLLVLKEQSETKGLVRENPERKARGRELVFRLRETAQRTQPPVAALLRSHGAPHESFWVANLIAVEGRRELVESLASRTDILAIESDQSFRVPLEEPTPASLSSSAIQSVEPGIGLVGAPNLWSLSVTGQTITFGSADTGVMWDHPALLAHYRGWNGTNATADHNYHWWDAIHEDLSGNGSNPGGFNSAQPYDDFGHGTHTTGIAVGDDGQGNQIGMAPGARWIACRNMDEGVGRPSTYLECMQFFLAPTDLAGKNPDPDRRPDCVGNSYSCPPAEGCAPLSMHLALENLRAAGIFMSAAAGNEGPACGTISAPPGLDSAVFSVGASTSSDTMAQFSSRGPVTVDGSNRRKPDLVAPGVGIRSSYPPSGYRANNGTSMAAPHVAGAVALLWSGYPQLRGNVDYTATMLTLTGRPVTTDQWCGDDLPLSIPNNVFGYGRLDVFAAYQAIENAPSVQNLSVQLPADGALQIQLLGADPQAKPLLYELVSTPTHGLLQIDNPLTGQATYRPAHGFAGSDLFSYRVGNGIYPSTNALVQITVLPLPDSDADTMPDDWETAHGLDAYDRSDGQADPDGDTVSNAREYAANTDPQSASSALKMQSIFLDELGHPALVWNSVGGTRYRVQWLNAQSNDVWHFDDLVRDVTLEMDPGPDGLVSTMSFVDDFGITSQPPPGWGRFYRVTVVK